MIQLVSDGMGVAEIHSPPRICRKATEMGLRGGWSLDLTTKDLREALDELHRRDAIGSPAARELLARQEEAMEAQKTALEVSTDRSFETLESLERMIISQGEQTARVQEVLSMVLKQLALEPRQHISMRDSVLTQENHSTPAMTEDLIALMG